MAGSRIRIDLAYDGAPFFGFARQRDRQTVQGVLEGALSRATAQPIELVCAGRTDRGVHARAQVVHADLDPTPPPAARFLADLDVARFRLDRLVGEAITIWKVRRVGQDFDARFSATDRRYRYRLVDAPTIDPLRRHDRWHVGERLRIGLMRQGAAHLVGEHDFASFCRKAPGRTTARHVRAISVHRHRRGDIGIGVQGNAFCHQQVRAMVGCLVEVGRGRRPPEWVGDVLRARDRAVAARVAPAHGLTLEHVSYGRSWPSAPPHLAPSAG